MEAKNISSITSDDRSHVKNITREWNYPNLYLLNFTIKCLTENASQEIIKNIS